MVVVTLAAPLQKEKAPPLRRRATGKPRGTAYAVPLSAWWTPPSPSRAYGTPGDPAGANGGAFLFI